MPTMSVPPVPPAAAALLPEVDPLVQAVMRKLLATATATSSA
jgi:hypothetical protein